MKTSKIEGDFKQACMAAEALGYPYIIIGMTPSVTAVEGETILFNMFSQSVFPSPFIGIGFSGIHQCYFRLDLEPSCQVFLSPEDLKDIPGLPLSRNGEPLTLSAGGNA